MNERIAQEGFWLTEANIEDEASRTFAKKVCGYGDLDSLFTEWSNSQKEEWESQHSDNEQLIGGGMNL